MKRHKQQNAPRQDNVKRSGPPQQPSDAGDSRDAHPVSVVTAASSEAATGTTHGSTPIFEHRDEHLSAFSSVQSANGAGTPQSAESPSSTSWEPRRESARRRDDEHQENCPEPLPFQTPPMRFYQRHQQHANSEPPAQYYSYHEQYREYHQPYTHHDHYDYSSYYPPPPNSDGHRSRMTPPSNQNRHPSYLHAYPQEYSSYPCDSYYPSTTVDRGPHPTSPYSAQSFPPHGQHYCQGATPPTPRSSIPDMTIKENPPEPSSRSSGRGIVGEEGLDPSSSPSLEDDRKPAPFECTPLRKSQPRQDFEPIPLNQIAAMPVLSSASATSATHPHSPSMYASTSSTLNAYPQAFGGAPFHRQVPTPPGHCSTVSRVAAPVAPPNPHSTPVMRRRQRQSTLLAPSSSGSTTSSGEGGSWERRFNELLEFKRTHGHCEVPQSYAENTSLGTWVNKQRMEQKNRTDGKNSSLNDARLGRLERIGFRWAKRKGQASWDEKFTELLAYKAGHGNCHVPTKYRGNTALGRWVSTQRAEYKKFQEGESKCSMNADKIRRLESIGFAWFMAL